MALTASLLVSTTAEAGFDTWFAQEVVPTVRGTSTENIDTNIPFKPSGATSLPLPDKHSSDSCLAAGTLCIVAYTGGEGVNLRTKPSGTKIVAAAYQQDAVPLRVLSEKPIYVNGTPWVEVQLNGWMAFRKLSRSSPYLAEVAAGKARVDWDGGENPKDNFISLKTAPDYSAKRIAKIFNRTEVEVGNTIVQGEFEWISAQLIGWMAAISPEGTRLLEPYSP